jgi:hypothetical protein
MNSGEDIQLVVEPATIELVENLEPDESVERNSSDIQFIPSTEYICPSEVENECDDKLKNGLAEDHFPHVERDDGRAFGFGLAVKEFHGWRIGR